MGLGKRFSLVPTDLRKRDVKNMQPPAKKDESIIKAEKLTLEWIHAYLDEVYRTDDFFKAKQDELIDEFICLQDKLRCKTQK